eukprot:jgi/Botrbrau1/10252/Bobra.0140s0008.1
MRQAESRAAVLEQSQCQLRTIGDWQKYKGMGCAECAHICTQAPRQLCHAWTATSRRMPIPQPHATRTLRRASAMCLTSVHMQTAHGSQMRLKSRQKQWI